MFLFSVVAAAETGKLVSGASKASVLDSSLQGYMAHRGTRLGRELLEKSQSQELQATEANIDFVREALAGKSTPEERILLVRALGKLFDRRDPVGRNAQIRKDLKGYVYSGERETARAATFAISRIGGEGELKQILLHAKSNKILDNDEYAGEIAHNLRFAAISHQADLLRLLEESRSSYAVDILTADLKSATFVNQYPLESRKKLLSVIERNEPSFTSAIGAFGYINAIRYATWLHAFALVNESLSRGEYAETVLRELNKPKTDPRKLIGYLTSPEADKFLLEVSKANLSPALTRIAHYADSLPQNQTIQDFAALVRIRTAAMRQ
ncbi:hypothetical protein [Massilia cavernae]|nr:hypothetical protein [Massilia cavernae]